MNTYQAQKGLCEYHSYFVSERTNVQETLQIKLKSIDTG